MAVTMMRPSTGPTGVFKILNKRWGDQAIWEISIWSCAGKEVQKLNINFSCQLWAPLRCLGSASQVQTSLAEVKNYGKYNRMGPPVER